MRKWVIAFLTLCVLFLQARLWFGEGSMAELVTSQDRLEQLLLENKRLYRRNEVLVREVVELQNGLDTVEEQARQELGMIRKGETFFLTYD